jgi:hypothetical protein
MELGIRLSFVKTSEFREGGFNPPNPPRYATAIEEYVRLCILDTQIWGKDVLFALRTTEVWKMETVIADR